MSKLSKFINNPVMFFKDSRIFSSVRKKTNKVVKIVELMDKTDVEFSNELISFQNRYPVDSIGFCKDEHVNLWPVFRHLFWVRLQQVYKKNKNVADVNPQKAFVAKTWYDTYRKSHACLDVDDIKNEEKDLLFFVNLRGTEQTIINGKVYHRITDPVFEKACEKYSCEKIEIVKSIGKLKSRWHHEPLNILPPLVRKVGYVNYFNAPSDFIKQVNNHIPSIPFVQKDINETIEWFFHMRDFYKDILIKRKPKAVFFVGFDYHYPLCLAAHELGIKAIDLQHGVQAGWSPVYNRWQELPKQGYKVFPDFFWVWGDYDKRKVEDNFNFNCNHKPIVAGFKWLDRQLELETGKSLILNVKLKLNKKKIGVITLQDQQIIPELIEGVVKNSSDSIFWIVKRHPKHSNIDMGTIKGRVESGKHIDNTPFAQLIQIADIHLTECSTSVIEADYFGVASFVFGEQGQYNYGDFIEQDTVHHIDTVQSFVDKLEAVISAEKKSRMNVVNNSSLEQALSNLMEQSDVLLNGKAV